MLSMITCTTTRRKAKMKLSLHTSAEPKSSGPVTGRGVLDDGMARGPKGWAIWAGRRDENGTGFGRAGDFVDAREEGCDLIM
jgi:hypothetical protein